MYFLKKFPKDPKRGFHVRDKREFFEEISKRNQRALNEDLKKDRGFKN